MPVHVDLGSGAVPMQVVRVDRLPGRKRGVRLQLAEGKANTLTATGIGQELALTVHGRTAAAAADTQSDIVAFEIVFDADRLAGALRTALLCGVWTPREVTP